MPFIKSETTTTQVRHETSLYDSDLIGDADTAIHLRWALYDAPPAGSLFLTVQDRINGDVATVSLDTDLAQALVAALQGYINTATAHNNNGGF